MEAQLLETAKQAAKQAAELLRNSLDTPGVVSSEGKDIKTLADQRANEIIHEILGGTEYPIVSEESELPLVDSWRTGGHWIIDPLDGTYNYTREFSIAGVSIAFWRDGQPEIGVVRDLFRDVEYAAANGQASCDQRPMKVSNIDDTSRAVIATGFPSGRSYDDDSLRQSVDKIRQYKKVRMLGCASLMIAMVAAGKFDVYEEEDIYLWDVAAGLALVNGAGGTFELLPGSGPWKYNVRASNGRI